MGFFTWTFFDPLSLIEQLAKTTGVVVTPKNHFDLVLSYISSGYCIYHHLPEDPVKGGSYVLDNVAEQGKKFKERYECPPCLVIDGVDLLAKSSPELFCALS